MQTPCRQGNRGIPQRSEDMPRKSLADKRAAALFFGENNQKENGHNIDWTKSGNYDLKKSTYFF
jgi:hypothetical protein